MWTSIACALAPFAALALVAWLRGPIDKDKQ